MNALPARQFCSAFSWPLRIESLDHRAQQAGLGWQNHRGFDEEYLELAKAVLADEEKRLPGWKFRLIRLSYEVIN